MASFEKKHIAMAVAGWLLVSSPAFAVSDVSPSSVVETAAQDLQQGLADGTLDNVEVRELLTVIDVDRIALFALGVEARRASADDLDAYKAAFRDYLAGQIRLQLGNLEGAKVDILDTEERSADDVIVETKVTGAGEEGGAINWRLNHTDTGWKIVDVEANDLWLVIELRAQFQDQLDKNNGDIQALTKELISKS